MTIPLVGHGFVKNSQYQVIVSQVCDMKMVFMAGTAGTVDSCSMKSCIE